MNSTGTTTYSGQNILPKVDCEEFYHGLLQSEDLPFLLEEIGDFVIRAAEVKRGAGWEIVISIRSSKGKSPKAIRNIILRQRKCSDHDEWQAIEATFFRSVKELINDYMSSKKPINPEVPSSVLLRGIEKEYWEFRHEDVVIKKLLGTGQFGEVRLGKALIDGKMQEVAIKCAKTPLNDSDVDMVKEKVKEIMHEARIMRYFDHPNVIHVHGVAVCNEPLMIIIELVKGGSLWKNLRNRKKKIEEIEKVENMTLGVARGLEYLHSKNCIHRDIATRNCLYTKENVIKISDFGLSRAGPIYKMKRSQKVPMRWTAPESMVTYQYTMMTDVFSFSILMWEIFSDGEEPYKEKTSLEVKTMVSCGSRMEKPYDCPDDIFDIMKKCWSQNPEERCTMSEAVKRIEEILEQMDDQEDDGQSIKKRKKNLSTMIAPALLSTRRRKRSRTNRKNHHISHQRNDDEVNLKQHSLKYKKSVKRRKTKSNRRS